MGTQDDTGVRTSLWLFAAAAAICWGAVTVTILHLISSHNPLFDTLSSYAYTDRGTGMLATSILSLAAGSLALLGALFSTGIPVSATTRVLFGTWSLGLTAAALFPASYPDHPHFVSGEIHQYSCLIALLSLPALGFSLRERFQDVRFTHLTKIATGSLLLFGISYLVPWLLPVGLAQRIALGVDVALLCRLLLLVREVTQKGGAESATHDGESVYSGDGRALP